MSTKKLTLTLKSGEEVRALKDTFFFGLQEMRKIEKLEDPIFENEKRLIKPAEEISKRIISLWIKINPWEE